MHEAPGLALGVGLSSVCTPEQCIPHWGRITNFFKMTVKCDSSVHGRGKLHSGVTQARGIQRGSIVATGGPHAGVPP